MADTMQFDLVTPERKLASAKVREVRIPGAGGDLTAMPDHAPLITTLRPGVLAVVAADGAASYAVTGGFAEVTGAGVSVLTERALPVGEVSLATIDALVSEAAANAASAPAERRDAAEKYAADMQALKVTLGL